MKLRPFAPSDADGFYPHSALFETPVSDEAKGEAMNTGKSPDLEVIKNAERVIYREKWRICGRAAQQSADTQSLSWTRLSPQSAVIRVVAMNGGVVGRIRRDGGRWIATGPGQRGSGRRCGTFRAALLSLACQAQR